MQTPKKIAEDLEAEYCLKETFKVVLKKDDEYKGVRLSFDEHDNIMYIYYGEEWSLWAGTAGKCS